MQSTCSFPCPRSQYASYAMYYGCLTWPEQFTLIFSFCDVEEILNVNFDIHTYADHYDCMGLDYFIFFMQ